MAGKKQVTTDPAGRYKQTTYLIPPACRYAIISVAVPMWCYVTLYQSLITLIMNTILSTVQHYSGVGHLNVPHSQILWLIYHGETVYDRSCYLSIMVIPSGPIHYSSLSKSISDV